MKDFLGKELKVGDIIIWATTNENRSGMGLREITEIVDNNRAHIIEPGAKLKDGSKAKGQIAQVNRRTTIFHKRPLDEGVHRVG